MVASSLLKLSTVSLIALFLSLLQACVEPANAIAVSPAPTRAARRAANSYTQRFCDEWTPACEDVVQTKCGLASDSTLIREYCGKKAQSLHFQCTCNGRDLGVDVINLIRDSTAVTKTLTSATSTEITSIFSYSVDPPKPAPSRRAASVVGGFCGDYLSGCDKRCTAIGSSTKYRTCTRKRSLVYVVSCTCSNGKENALHAYGINAAGDPTVTQTTRTHTTFAPAPYTTVTEYPNQTLKPAPTGQLITGGKYARTSTSDQTLIVSDLGSPVFCDPADETTYDYFHEECMRSKLEYYVFIKAGDGAPSGRSFYTLNNATQYDRVVATDITSLYKAGDAGCTYGSVFMASPKGKVTGPKTHPILWDILYADEFAQVPLVPYVEGPDGAHIKLQASLNDTSISIHPDAQHCDQTPITLTYTDPSN